MSGRKKEYGQTNNSSLTTGYTAPQAVEIINMFTTFYPPEQAKETLWQLLATSFSGTEGDEFTPAERSNLLLFYRLAGELAEAVYTLYPKTTTTN
jgi:hypothetical protein